MPDPPRHSLIGIDVSKAQLVVRAAVDIDDLVVTRTLADDVVIRAAAAVVGLVARPHHEEIDARRAVHRGRAGSMRADPRFIDRQCMRHALQIEPDRYRLIGRDQHLHDIGLVDRHRPAQQVARAAWAVIGVDLPQQLVPPGQVIEHRIVDVGDRHALRQRRRMTENLLEQRRQLTVAQRAANIDRNRLVAVAGRIIGKALGKAGQPALQREAHRKAPRGGDVLLHHRLQQLDHRIDARDIARRIGRKVGPGARSHRIGQMPGGLVQDRTQHFRAEVDPAQRSGKVELRRGQQLDPEGAVVARIYFIKFGERDRVIAQRELAGIPGLPLQLQRPVKVARPDEESAVGIGDLHRVIHHLTIGEAHPDRIDRQIGIGIEADLLHAPLGPRRVPQRGYRRLAGIADRRIRSELPAPVSLPDPVIQNDRPAIHDPRQVRRLIAQHSRRPARGRRPALLKAPPSPECRAVPHLPLKQGSAIGRQPHRIELARQLERRPPGPQHSARLLDQRLQIGRSHGGGGGGCQRAQIGIVGHRDRQVGDRTKALRVKRGGGPGGRAGFARVFCQGIVDFEQRIVGPRHTP